MIDEYGWEKTNALAALASVGTVQFVLGCIILYKYWEDLMIVVRGEGHIPYDKSLQKDSDYFQSDRYWKDVADDEKKREKRRKVIEKAKQKTEASERPLFVGYFDPELTDPTRLLDSVDPAIEEAKANAILSENKEVDEVQQKELRQRRR